MYLSIRNVCDICDLMGITVDRPSDENHLNYEVWIGEGTIKGENGEPDYVGLLAHDGEYPEEGAIALETSK